MGIQSLISILGQRIAHKQTWFGFGLELVGVLGPVERETKAKKFFELEIIC